MRPKLVSEQRSKRITQDNLEQEALGRQPGKAERRKGPGGALRVLLLRQDMRAHLLLVALKGFPVIASFVERPGQQVGPTHR